MKITKRKRTVPAKRKSSVPVKQEKVTLEGRTGHWSQWIKPKGAALLSQTLGPVYFVVKNRGPNDIWLAAQCGDLIDVRAGDVRATYAHGTITVKNRGAKPVLIEFEFVPIHIKP